MPEANTPDAETLSKATEQLIETLPAANAAPPAGEKPAEPTAQATAVPDVDDQELIDARAALAAEEAAKTGGAPKPTENLKEAKEPPAPAAQPAAGTDGTPAPEDDKSSIMIPKARLDEVLRQRDEFSNRASYLAGVVEANKEMRQGTQTPAQTDTSKPAEPPAKTVPEVLAEINTAIVALAEKYDQGEMTAAEWRRQEIALQTQAETIRVEVAKIDADRIMKEATDAARQEGMNERLQSQADDLDTKHPALLQLPADGNHPRWAFLREEAAQSLADQGVVLKQGDAKSLMVFRERIAELADQYVPIWTGKPVPAASPPASGSPAPAPAPKQPSIADQRRAKLELAHQQPPDSANLGASGVKPELTDAQVGNMSDDEIANLPASTRARITGRAA